MSDITRIKNESVIDQVYNQLKENILEGHWTSGKKIPSENQLAAMFGVSRMTVRAAIQKLATFGLLDVRVGEGTFVKEFSPNAYFQELVPLVLNTRSQLEILEFRKALEAEAIRIAIKKASDDEIAELDEIYQKMTLAFQTGNSGQYIREEYFFHLKILKMSGNSIFVDVIETMKDIIYSHYYVNLLDDGGASNKGGADDPYKLMINAFKRRDLMSCLDSFFGMIDRLMRLYETSGDMGALTK